MITIINIIKVSHQVKVAVKYKITTTTTIIIIIVIIITIII